MSERRSHNGGARQSSPCANAVIDWGYRWQALSIQNPIGEQHRILKRALLSI